MNNDPLRKKLRNKIILEISKAKRSYNNKRVSSLRNSDPGRWHKEVRNFANIIRKDLTITIPDANPDDHVFIANEINNHLSSFSQSQNPINLENLPAFLPSPIPPPNFHPMDIYEDLKRVSLRKACGTDNIPHKVLRECAYELSLPICNVINASISQGRVPYQWKCANVIPLPKQYPHTIDKLRPISLTSTIAKIAEKKMSKFILDSIRPQLDIRQFGNQKGVSTTHCLIEVYHQLISAAEKSGNINTLVLTDFSKAFDMVDHTIAFHRLHEMGISPTILQWVINFISERKQRVKYKGVYSNWVTLTGGVPQGTIIAPIICLCSISNALSESGYDGVRVWKYVDDLTLGESLKLGENSDLQRALDSLTKV